MNKRNNEEKLRILQERLAQIKEKENVEQIHTKEFEDTDQKDTPQKEREATVNESEKKNKSWAILRNLILFSVIIYGFYYAYNNIKINIPTNNIEANQEKQDEIKQSLVYNLNFGDATHIILVGNAGNENVVKGIVNTMNVKGYKSDYFYLPDVTNSEKSEFRAYIGPYFSLEEANQWAKSLEIEFEVITLNN